MQILQRICLILGIIVQFTRSNCEELEEKEWWETASVYQIWPRAFQDSDGDGEGDLQGIISRLDYIKDLGVNAIWLNPIYESPWVDSGYDVTDHNKIHPTFGDVEDINLLIEEAHERDLKVILDIVPNHSSTEHSWFNLSRSEIEPYDDFYIWANGTIDDAGNRIEPNNWVSFYDEERNGSAWTWDATREQWYYHKFHHSQPDLNLENEDVVEKIMETLEFWLEKGVDGFYFSSVSYYFENDLEDENDDDNETRKGNGDNDDDNDNDDNNNDNKDSNDDNNNDNKDNNDDNDDNKDNNDDNDNNNDNNDDDDNNNNDNDDNNNDNNDNNDDDDNNNNDNDDNNNDNNDNNDDEDDETSNKNIALLYRFRRYVDDWVEENNATSKLLIAGSDDPDERLITYYGNGTQAGIIPFNYRLIRAVNSSSNAEDIKNTIHEWMDLLPENATTNWLITDHDHSRTPSRIGLEEAELLQILSLLLPGQTFTYYGEEIKMEDTQVPWNEMIDPMTCENLEENFENFSRDFARTPMQWNSSISAGFSTTGDTFLPLNPLFEEVNVEDQLDDPFSSLNIYKKVSLLRKESRVFTHGGYELETINDNRVLLLKRFLDNYPTYIAVLNLESSNETINLSPLYPELEDNFEVVISTDPDFQMTEIEGSFLLTGNEAVVLKGNADANETTTLIFDEDAENIKESSDLNSEIPHETDKKLQEKISDKDAEENGATRIFQSPISCILFLIFWIF